VLEGHIRRCEPELVRRGQLKSLHNFIFPVSQRKSEYAAMMHRQSSVDGIVVVGDETVSRMMPTHQALAALGSWPGSLISTYLGSSRDSHEAPTRNDKGSQHLTLELTNLRS
jgi:hypothetical protein